MVMSTARACYSGVGIHRVSIHLVMEAGQALAASEASGPAAVCCAGYRIYNISVSESYHYTSWSLEAHSFSIIPVKRWSDLFAKRIMKIHCIRDLHT